MRPASVQMAWRTRIYKDYTVCICSEMGEFQNRPASPSNYEWQSVILCDPTRGHQSRVTQEVNINILLSAGQDNKVLMLQYFRKSASEVICSGRLTFFTFFSRFWRTMWRFSSGRQIWIQCASLFTLMSAPDRSSFARMRSSRVTSSATVMRLVWIWKILLLVFSSGRGNSIFRSILPEEKEETQTSRTAAAKRFLRA